MDDKILKFTVLGNPVGKQRVRFNPDAPKRFNPKTKKFTRRYGKTPAKTVSYEKLIRQECQVAMFSQKFKQLEVAVQVDLYIFCPIPQKLKITHQKDSISCYPLPICHPDGDNVAKAILDALNGVLYRDDRQVSDISIKKRYSDNPRVEIEARGLL